MTHSWRMLLLAAALLAGALLVAACGGGGGDDSEPGATEATDGDTTDGDSEPSGGALDDLLSLTAAYGLKEVKVTYRMSGAGLEGEEGTMTIYWKPGIGWRIDFSSDGSEGSFIVKADESYICAMEGGEGQCLVSPLGTDLPVPFLGSLTDPGEFGSLIDETFLGADVDRSSRTIAGRDAECFAVMSSALGEDVSAEYCFGDGLLLYLSADTPGVDGGAFTLEAIEIEDGVSDADLEPIYPVLEIPGLDDTDLDDILEDFDIDDILEDLENNP